MRNQLLAGCDLIALTEMPSTNNCITKHLSVSPTNSKVGTVVSTAAKLPTIITPDLICSKSQEEAVFIHPQAQLTMTRAQKMIIKMLGIIALIFFLCYFPVHCQHLLNRYAPSCEESTTTCQKLYWAYAITGVY